MAQNEQTTEEHSTLEQQSPGRLDHPAWCVVWSVDITVRPGPVLFRVGKSEHSSPSQNHTMLAPVELC